jgi:hypothetical protein
MLKDTSDKAKRITYAIFTFINSLKPADAPESVWNDADWIRNRYGELREKVGFTEAERQAVTDWLEEVLNNGK